jgi:hypothetical protein
MILADSISNFHQNRNRGSSPNFFARSLDIAYTGSTGAGQDERNSESFCSAAMLVISAGWSPHGPTASSRYFEFPPRTVYIEHAPFSWIAFISYSLFIMVAVSPFLLHAFRHRKRIPIKTHSTPPFDSAALRSGRPLGPFPSFGTSSRAKALVPKLRPDARGRFPRWGWFGVALVSCPGLPGTVFPGFRISSPHLHSS